MRHLHLATSGPVVLAAVLYALWEPADETFTHEQILDAIWQVESGGRLHPPAGDGGQSIGPLQIQRLYFLDSGVGGDYERCLDIAFAKRVVEAYMKRKVPEAWASCDAETIARVHNGGPRGATRPSTLGYWKRVQAELRKRR